MKSDTIKGKPSSVRQRKHQERQRQSWITYGVITLIVALALVYLAWPRPKAQPLSAERLAADPALGPISAPATIIEYADFGCPACKSWHQSGVVDQVRAKYGDKVRFIWRDYPVITAQSPKAAEAAQCAYDQGKFWEYHNYLYEKASSIDVNTLKSAAVQVGLETTTFNACLDSGQDAPKVERSQQEAQRYGFQGTPSFMVNGKALVGPPTTAALQQIIDPILAAGG